MSQKILNLDDLIKEFEKYKNEIYNFEENSKDQISSLKKEIKIVKELNDKTKDFLLLELESNLDKQNQFKLKLDSQEEFYTNTIKLLNNENTEKNNELCKLNEKLGKLKYIIEDNEKILKSLELKNNELKNQNESYLEDKNELTNEINVLNEFISDKDNVINDLNVKVNSLQDAKMI